MNSREEIIKQIRARIMAINENIRGNIYSLSLSGNFDSEVSEKYFEDTEKTINMTLEADRLKVVVQDLDKEFASEINVMNGQLQLKVKADEVCSELRIEDEDMYFITKKFLVDTTNFKVTENYTYLKGTIYAISGNIGGWTISGSSLVGSSSSGVPAAIDGGRIEALSAKGSSFFFQTLDFNPENDSEIHEIDLDNATISTSAGASSGMPTSFGDLTILGPVRLSDSLTCGDLNCTELRCQNGSGSYGTIYCDEIITQDESFSDRRLKRDICYMNSKEGEAVLKLRPVKFRYKENGRRAAGFIAQDIIRTLPEYSSMIVDEVKGYYAICERQLIPLMILQIQNNIKRLRERERYVKNGN